MVVEQSSAIGSYMFESAQDGLIAQGNNQATALPLGDASWGKELNRFTSVPVGTGCRLPPAQSGLTIVVINHGANPLQVYGALGDAIDDQAAVAGVSQMPNSVVWFMCLTTGQWYSEGLATGYTSGGQAGSTYQTVAYQDGVTAHPGGGQANGVPVIAMQTRIATVGTAGDSLTLPPSKPGMQLAIFNGAAVNSANVFPAVGEQINALGANVALGVAALAAPTVFFCFTAGQWFTK